MMSTSDLNFEYQFRLILIGDSTVGKSSLLRQFTEGRFIEVSDPTVGVDFHARIVNLDGVPIKLQLWDTAGQERFRSITRSYYRNAAGGLLVYDITNRTSFEHVKEWLDEASRCAEPNRVVFIMVGHKTDQVKQRRVTTQEGEQLAEQLGIQFVETSAKSGTHVEDAFYKVAKEIYRLLQTGEVRVKDGWDGVKKATPRRGINAAAVAPGPQQPPTSKRKADGCCG
ncbi:ras-related protein Rab-39B-like [Corticium candelabrum]|uniref:ras-related protein Rab-39B-like n=1 Tax=Corticium candelabrum TaxID=121492 RepID=UPI002E2755D1|nr:ras-related protein Rab-39B-like [Corticium candelabrum]